MSGSPDFKDRFKGFFSSFKNLAFDRRKSHAVTMDRSKLKKSSTELVEENSIV